MDQTVRRERGAKGMTRAVVIKTVGDPKMAGAIADAMSQRVIPLDDEELAKVKAELARIKAEKRMQDARMGVRKKGEDERWHVTQRQLATYYRDKPHGAMYWLALKGWALMWCGIYAAYEYLSAWNRESPKEARA